MRTPRLSLPEPRPDGPFRLRPAAAPPEPSAAALPGRSAAAPPEPSAAALPGRSAAALPDRLAEGLSDRLAGLVPDRPAVVLVAHGSRDPRAAVATEALTQAVGLCRPEWEVRASYLDHAGPRPLDVLASLGARRAVLVPLLLTAAYHGRVDLPAVIRDAQSLPVSVTATEVLGPASPLLLAAVCRRLPAVSLDAVVLAAAGTRDAAARETVAAAGDALGARVGLPSAVGYASGPGGTPGEAVAALRAAGARRVGMAAYFLAPGFLYDAAVRSSVEAGAVAVAEPLGATPELVQLVAARAEAVLGAPLTAAA